MKTFTFSIVTPEGIVVSDQIHVVEMRSSLGAFGVMADHQPMVADCPAGKVRMLKDGKWTSYNCDAGVFAMDGKEAQILTSFARISDESACPAR